MRAIARTEEKGDKVFGGKLAKGLQVGAPHGAVVLHKTFLSLRNPMSFCYSYGACSKILEKRLGRQSDHAMSSVIGPVFHDYVRVQELSWLCLLGSKNKLPQEQCSRDHVASRAVR